MTKRTLALISLLGFSGCFVDLDNNRHHRDSGYYHDGYYDDGYYSSFLTVYWTVDGTTDPGACRDGDVSDISIIVDRNPTAANSRWAASFFVAVDSTTRGARRAADRHSGCG